MVKDHLRYMNEMLEVNHRWKGEDVLLGKPQVPQMGSQYALPLEISTAPGGYAGRVQRKGYRSPNSLNVNDYRIFVGPMPGHRIT